MSKKQIKIFIFGTVFGIAVALGVVSLARFLGIHLFVSGSASQQLYDKAKVVEKCIDKYYQGEVKDEELVDNGVKGMVSALGDKYSRYYTDEEYKELMEGINGTYVGIGVTLRQQEDTSIVVSDVTSGGPANKAGVKAGDKFVRIEGKDMSGMKLDELISLIKSRDNEGKVISISLERTAEDGSVETLEKKVICEEIEVVSVTAEKYGEVGYIRIKEFDKETDEQFVAIMENMRSDSVKGLVIDVRDNGGGSLDSVIHMLDELLPEGDLITEKSKKDGDKVYHSTNDKSYDKPVAVLMNGNSASASEVFAGTMQARGAAELVGTTSFGKGIVQTVFSLERSCGGGIKLTTAEYFLPNGVSIHKKGLTPDVKAEFEGAEDKKFKYGEDNQLEAALETVLNQ